MKSVWCAWRQLAVSAVWLGLSAALAAAQPEPEIPSADRLAVEAARLALDHGAARLAAHAGAHEGFVVRAVARGADGTRHVRFDRTYHGLPVIGGDVIVRIGRDTLYAGVISGLGRRIAADPQPRVGAEHARQQALVASRAYFDRLGPRGARLQAGAADLVLFAPRSDSPARLGWRVRVNQQGRTPGRHYSVVVGARWGQVIGGWPETFDALAVGTGNTLYSGAVPINANSRRDGLFELVDVRRGLSSVKSGRAESAPVRDADNLWGSFNTTDPATVAADVAYGQALAWDYFKQKHRRNGLTGSGAGLPSVVNPTRWWDPFGWLDIENAWFSPECGCFVFGNGSAQLGPLVSIDVVGHEASHAVTAYSLPGDPPGLIYAGESGGLNEATSDIFGSMIEFFAANPGDTPDYDIGERLRVDGVALRRMHQPSLDGASVDCWYDGVAALDVHQSSGIGNHFFYLLAEGSRPRNLPSSPTCQAGDRQQATGSASLKGLGRDKAARIWYAALTTRFTRNASFHDARDATIGVAIDLYGQDSAEHLAVESAWDAVGVLTRYRLADLGDLPGSADFSMPYALNASGEVTGCSSGISNGCSAFRWADPGPMAVIGALPNRLNCVGRAINSAGVIGGYCSGVANYSSSHGFLWQAQGGMTELTGVPSPSDYAEVTGVDDAGNATIYSGGLALVHGGAGWTTIGPMIPDGFMQPFHTAANGWVAGYGSSNPGNSSEHLPFRWSRASGMQILGDLPGGNSFALARGINCKGEAAGRGTSALAGRAVFWPASGSPRDLGTLLLNQPPVGGQTPSSEAYGVNGRGRVVGFSVVPTTTAGGAFVWSELTGMHDLQARIHPDDPLRAQTVLRHATAINDGGQITAWARVADKEHAVLLTPTAPQARPVCPAAGP